MAGHGRHASPSSYVPAARTARTARRGGPPKPAAQRQTVTSVEDGSEVEFPGQAEHAALPAASLNVPARHAEHATPSAPVYPGLHRQASAADCAVNAWLEFVGQGVHAAEPEAALYVETGHAEHAPLSAPVYPASHTQMLLIKRQHRGGDA